MTRDISREQCARVSSIIAVPTLLFFIDWLSQVYRSPESEFLLVPPLAVIIYLIFSKPDASYVNFRSIVVTPVLGSAIGELCYLWFRLTPWGVAIATLAVLIIQLLMRSNMPPALALAVLAMLLKAEGPGYTVSVAVATLLIWVIFLAWRRLLWEPLAAGSRSPSGMSSA